MLLLYLPTNRIFTISAGGEQTFALSLPGSREGEIDGASSLDEGTLDLIRKFSVIKPATSFFTTATLLQMVSLVQERVLMRRRIADHVFCLTTD